MMGKVSKLGELHTRLFVANPTYLTTSTEVGSYMSSFSLEDQHTKQTLPFCMHNDCNHSNYACSNIIRAVL